MYGVGARGESVSVFQFHFGSIKSQPNEKDNSDYATFQFHFGSIKSLFGHCFSPYEIGFNSTLVQLKVVSFPKPVAVGAGFNSTLVQLKAKVFAADITE